MTDEAHARSSPDGYISATALGMYHKQWDSCGPCSIHPSVARLPLSRTILTLASRLQAQKTLAGRRAAQRSPAEFLRRLKEAELVQLVVHIQPIEDTTQEVDLLRRLQQAAAASE